jgi:hypothetical protein
LHCDDTIIPVLAPKTGQAKKGRMWVVVSDGCPYQGSDPPAVVYFYSPDRKGEHPRAFMKGFSGVLQADGFTGFNAMYQPDPLTQEIQVKAERGTTVAFSGCWAYWRRKFYDVHESTDSPIAKEALDRIGKLYNVERTISGKTKEQRKAVRDTKSRPLTKSFKTWLEARLKELPEKFDLTSTINYGLSRWDAFTLFLDDPAVAIDNNAAERAIRPLVLGRRNWTFAGSDRGAENAATIMTIVETAKANDLNPQTYIADLLNRLPDHKINRIEDLAPWNSKTVQ